MKIVKLPDHVIFDTDNASNMEFKRLPRNILRSLHPLHQVTTKTDWDFLSDLEHVKWEEQIVAKAQELLKENV